MKKILKNTGSINCFSYSCSIIIFASLFIYLQVNPEYAFSQDETLTADQCYNCHAQLDGTAKTPADMYRSDVHFRRGIACSSCHGGDSKEEDMDIAMSPEKGFFGIPRGGQVMKICSKCHEKEYSKLIGSVHGESSTGKGIIINNCITCHGVHNITNVNSPGSRVRGANIVKTCSGCHSNAAFMKSYNPGINIDQLEKYKTSVHGKKIFQGDNKVASCASCHGSHDIMKVNDPNSKVYRSNIPNTCGNCHSNAAYMKEYNIPTDQFEKYKSSVHGIAVLEKGDKNSPTCNNCHGNHGASPPEVSSVIKVCGTCHVLNAQMFSESPHNKVFEDKGIPECVACHGSHGIYQLTDENIGIGEKSVCIQCHKNDKGSMVAASMKQMIDSLISEVDVSQNAIKEAEQKGMDVSDAKFDYNDINKVLITSRNVMHYSNLDKFSENIQAGFIVTEKAKISGNEAVKDYYFRRLGLGISTFFITLLVIVLFLKLKRIEKRQKDKITKV